MNWETGGGLHRTAPVRGSCSESHAFERVRIVTRRSTAAFVDRAKRSARFIIDPHNSIHIPGPGSPPGRFPHEGFSGSKTSKITCKQHNLSLSLSHSLSLYIYVYIYIYIYIHNTYTANNTNKDSYALHAKIVGAEFLRGDTITTIITIILFLLLLLLLLLPLLFIIPSALRDRAPR